MSFMSLDLPMKTLRRKMFRFLSSSQKHASDVQVVNKKPGDVEALTSRKA